MNDLIHFGKILLFFNWEGMGIRPQTRPRKIPEIYRPANKILAQMISQGQATKAKMKMCYAQSHQSLGC